MSVVIVLCTAWGLSGCSDDSAREVWIADMATLQGGAPAAGAPVQLIGTGFGRVQALTVPCTLEAAIDPAASGLVAQPIPQPHSVLVGGVSAVVYARDDDCLVLQVPDLDPGPHFVVVWTDGIASNAFPINVAATTVAE